MTGLTGRRRWAACGITFAIVLAATSATVGDFGLTWDEPAYRHSQLVSMQWWERLAIGPDRASLFTPEGLLYYWPYGRFGINFHPPLAGQLNLLSYALFGGFLKDIPARRMASVIEFSLAATLLFGFLARRCGAWVGAVAAGALVLMPRLYGQAHLIDTDTPGLLLWAATALAFWKGLREPKAGAWRVAVGVLAGLAFVEKMGAVMVVFPLLAWMAVARFGRGGKAAWIDGVLTSSAMIAPLLLAFLEVRRLSLAFKTLQSQAGVPAWALSPSRTNLFHDHPETWMPGAILLMPLGIWLARRLAARMFPRGALWGTERPALEIWSALLAFAPAVAWLGNPAWWREALPRLAHYYAITTTRRGVLPDIQILYLGRIYEYSLPWHNAWVLMAITVPASILIASILGLAFAPWRDRLPLYFLLHLMILPVARMFPTPAHDGVRLFLPSFFFLAAFAGWGAIGLADRVGGRWSRPVAACLSLAPAAWGLIAIHPFELSYYNEFVGGPRGAWRRGFELSYWYDAFTPEAIAEINARLPAGAEVEFPNTKTNPVMVMDDQQALGVLRGDADFGSGGTILGRERFPYIWLLTHDSKADAFSRLLYAMEPWYALRPRQLGGARVATVADPESASRAWALQLLLDAPDRSPPDRPATPAWVRSHAPWLGRFWGEGVTRAAKLAVNHEAFDWARADPQGFSAAAVAVAQGRRTAGASRMKQILDRYPERAAFLLKARPQALVEAAKILCERPEVLKKVLLRYGFTDAEEIP